MSRPAQSLRLTLVSAVTGLVVAGALLTTAGAHAETSYSTSSYAGRLLGLVNDARAQLGLQPLVLAMGTTTVAWGWTEHLAQVHALSHNQHLGRQLSTHGSSRWRVYGENVGVGSTDDPDGLFDAYMHSPEHRANILNRDYRYVGVAVVFTGSRSWNTFDFVDVYGMQAMHHAGGRHVGQGSQHADSAKPKVSSRPVAVAPAAPTPPTGQAVAAASVAPAGQAAADASAERAGRAASVRASAGRASGVRAVVARVASVHVKALHHVVASRPVGQHRSGETAAGLETAAPAHVVASNVPLPIHRTQPVLLALAVLAIAFVARRWMLVVVRPSA